MMIAPARSHPGEARKAGRPPTLTDAERRRRILVAAEDLFLGRGYAATSMDDVAHACGMSKKTLYRLFDHKQSLFAALIEAVVDNLPRHAVPANPVDADGEALVRRTLGDLANLLLDPRRIALARLVAVEAPSAPELAESLYERGVRRADALLHDLLVDLRRRGRLGVEPDLPLARTLIGAATGDFAALSIIGAPVDASREAVEARIARVLDLVRPVLFGGKAGRSAR